MNALTAFPTPSPEELVSLDRQFGVVPTDAIHNTSRALALLLAFMFLAAAMLPATSQETNKTVTASRPGDLTTPPMTEDEPAPGKRVRQVAEEYKDTKVYHALYLPTDWVPPDAKPGKRYPVIVEYTGNKFPPCGSTGQVRHANLGYGMSGGEGFIWVTMPYVQVGKKENAVTWWGDKDATVDYCKTNLPRMCARFGGDPKRVVLCGFSRGAIACSYLGLADEDIAKLWVGMFAHDHFDGQKKWGYPNSDRAAALKRLARLKGRPVFLSGGANEFLKEHPTLGVFTFQTVPVAKIFDIPEGPVIHPHTDLWMHRDSDQRKKVRSWLAEVCR